MRIGITGAHGFLGWHMRCFLHSQELAGSCVLAGRETFADADLLDSFVRDCDVIFHFAGVNRARSDEEVRSANPEIARQLVAALERTNITPHVIYSSSTHADGDSVYGQAKRAAGEIIEDWAARVSARYTTVIFPHLYGECGKPHYNSAVHTFCHQVAQGEEPTVTGNGQLNLLHAQDAARVAWEAFRGNKTGEIRPEGRSISVREVAEKLVEFHASYTGGVMPDLRDPEDCKLFNVLRTSMFPAAYPFTLKRNEDPRGWLFEAIREENGGQIFISSTNPGHTRGDHYHRFKVERFCVLSGEAVIRIRRLFSDDIQEFPVSGSRPCFVDMPPLHTHSISNESDSDVITLFWANEFFDPDKPDTYRETVLSEKGN